MLLALMPIVWPDDAPVAPPPEAAPMLGGILLAPRRPKRPEQDETPAALYDSGTIELTLTIDGHAQRVGPMRHARVPSYGLTASIRVRQSTRLDVLALDLIADVLGDWD